jgi:TonB family protein
MAAKNKPYELFGGYILFKKLETGALGELWRAGRIDGDKLGATVALRRFLGTAKETVGAATPSAKQIIPLLSGTSFARDQVADIADGVPFIAYDYAGGRSLRHIVDRSRGDTGATPNPIPLDQAIVIAEKVALSLATTEELRVRDRRLSHAGLIPQFVWITDEGEIRVAGQQIGRGIVAALPDPKVAAELGRYFAPEYQVSGEPTKASEVYSLGALLYLLVTGQEPPDPLNASAFSQAVRAAKTTSGEPIPDDIRALLDRSLTVDPSQRYGGVPEMKTALTALANSGRYSATTFNLAFYLSSLLKKEMEGESIDRDKEARVAVAPYLEPEPVAAPIPTPVALPPAPSYPSPPASPLSLPAEKTRSKAPLAIAAIVVLAVAAGGAFMMMSKKEAAPAKPVATASVAPAPKIVSQPVVVTPPDGVTTSTATSTAATSTDPNAANAAFEKAVEQRMQEEMMKMQSQYNKQLQQQGSKLAPVVTAPPAAVAAPATDRSPSAAQLDQQRLQAREETAAAPATATVAPATATQAVQQAAAPPVAAPAAAAVAEGDVVDINSLDTVPTLVRPLRPEYPMIAARQHVEGTVIVTALVSERGEVLEVRVLGGERRMGLDDAAVRAMRAAKFSPGIKDGKRVKTWFPQRINFKL